MVDRDFKEIKEKLDYINALIESAMGKDDRKGFENKKIYAKLEGLQSEIESVGEFIEYMNKKTIVGHLEEMEDGKFRCKEFEVQFSCGSRVEALIKSSEGEEAIWCMGRVEHNRDGGYYFYNYNGNNVYLYDGMKVRVR